MEYYVGDVERGIAIARSFVARMKERFGEKHFNYALAQGVLAVGLTRARQDAEALREFRAAMPVLLTVSRENEDDDQSAVAAREARPFGVHWTFAPMLDLAQDARWGRIVEGPGEDPFLGSQLVPDVIKKIQEQGVWACAKHYVCNHQEANRTNINTIIDERTLREIYLPPFEAAVKEGHTATVMGAYNFMQIGALTSAQCCESSFLLNQVLKTEWGFKGFVMSDYDAIHNGVNAFFGGCDLDLPNGQFMNANNLGPLFPNSAFRINSR